MAARTRDRDSAGRLLRVLEDCELFHMEAAIASLGRVRNGIRSESLMKPSGGDGVDALQRTAEGRVLSLSDHKRIAKLQAALTAIANAYDIGDKMEESGEKQSNRNLVCTVAGIAMMQAMRDCTASRMNCCIWGSQAEKLHVFLAWMVKRENVSEEALLTRDYVRQLLLEWIHPRTEKHNQMAACLALFELLQRRRRELMDIAPTNGNVWLLEGRVGAYMDALHALVERGTVRVTDSDRVKPSKLALIAVETLALLCGDIAAQYMVPNEAEKVDIGLLRKMVESMGFVLATMRHWHLHSARRQFLGFVLQHMQSYVSACDSVLARPGSEHSCDQDLKVVAALDVLCWHWEVVAPLLCTRSDASSRIHKSHPSEVLVRVLKKWTFDIEKKTGFNIAMENPELVYAQVRYICVLMDLIGGIKGCSKAFGGFSAETKAYFIFFFVQGLSVSTKNADEATLLLVLKVLRAILLPQDTLCLMSTQDEAQTFISQLLNTHCNMHETFCSGSRSQTELELFVSDFVISRGLFITEFVQRVQDARTQVALSAISLVRTFLYQLDRAATQSTINRHWRKQLTPGVLGLIGHQNYRVHRLSLACLPSLDRASSIAGLCATGIEDPDNHIFSLVIGYLFNISTQYFLEMMASWFVGAYQIGSVQAHSISSRAPVSPCEWNGYATQQGGGVKGNIADDVKRKEVQEKLLSLCCGPSGWSKYVQPAKIRSEILHVLLHKIFHFPRDTQLLRMLRELVGCGWVDREVFENVEKQLCAHMMNLPRLSEEFLDDNSSTAAKAIEGLLFSRLAPLLVLRMLPRGGFGSKRITPVLCGREDLDHLNDYVDRHLQSAQIDPETTLENDTDTTTSILFHILARSVVDPLEFKEVKMLATECLAKLPSPAVLPFVLAYLVAFLQETSTHDKRDSSCIVNEESIPNSCGLVTAKLMVYYLNRVFSEDDHIYKSDDITSRAFVMLIQILGIPITEGDDSLLTDLQRGCIDCVALILSRLSEDSQDGMKKSTTRASSMMNALLAWIFGAENEEDTVKDGDGDNLGLRVQKLLKDMWSEARHHELPLQVRICCCNVLLSAIARSEISVLRTWKIEGFISRVALSTENCLEEDIAAGGLQIIFSLLYKGSAMISMEDNGDLQLVRKCFEATTTRLESTRNEAVTMNGLKVVGALIGKLPDFVGTLPPAELQRLIDRCLITVRNRQVSPVVSELAQSLLQAMTPP